MCGSRRANLRSLLVALLLAALLLAMAAQAWAGGPRFVSGSQYGNQQGVAMAFYTNQPLYFTDPGALNANVTHTQADAMVAAAAAVWNVPMASLVLAQGGLLAEHVTSANASVSNNGVVFPADVMAANYQSIQIPVIYDTDGSVTELLLGQGASSVMECRQNGVTESVDGFGTSPTITHAVIVLNGRCVGTNAQQLLQMQYQLMRVFGRVLGLAWAQVNDNVFTGATTPTAAQMANWPVMHPIDIICGNYTYQCMQNPFQLRPDDLSTLAMLYPVGTSNVPAGKTPSLANANTIEGWVMFPNQQGMALLNMTVTQVPVGQPSWQPWQSASAVTGIYSAENFGNPVTGPATAAEDVGTPVAGWDQYFRIGAVPLVAPVTGLRITEESINPLYTGDHALGPYERPPVTVSGAAQTEVLPFAQPNQRQDLWFTNSDAPVACNPVNDGTESAPAAVDPSGLWSGLLCGVGHTSWFNTTVQANRTWTIETTAVDETGAATLYKAQPVIGVWNGADATGQLPTVAAQPVAMNAMALGVTQVLMASGSAAQSVRVAVADQFGDGRPDFAYGMRVLYADHLQPTVVGPSGGTITITGMGFRSGNQLLVNGVRATVTSWSATQIVATAPAMVVGAAVDVEVLDAQTGGSTTMSAVLTYNPALAGTVSLSPSATAYVAARASLVWPLTLTTSPAQGGLAVNWTAAGAITLSGQQTVTGAVGTATATASVSAPASGATGSVTACAWTNVCASWGIVSVDPAAWTVAVAGGAGQSVRSGQTLGTVSLEVTDGAGHALEGAPVTVHQTVYAWEGACPAAGPCASAPVLATQVVTATSDAAGRVVVVPLQVAGQPQSVEIAAATGTAGFVTVGLVVTP